MQKKRKLFQSLRRVMKINGISVFLFDLIYKLFTVMIVTYFVRHVISYALKLSGFSYLTASNAVRFFCSVPAVIACFLIAAMFFVLCSVEMSCLFTAYQACVGGVKLNAARIFVFGGRNFRDLFRTKNKRVIFLVTDFYLITGCWILIRLIKHTRPFSYIITEFSSYPGVKVLGTVLFAALVCAALRRTFVPSVSILRGISYRESCKENKKICRGHWPVILGVCLLINASVWIFYQALQFVLKVAATAIIFLLCNHKTGLAMALTVSVDLDLAALVLSSVFAHTLNVGVVTFLFYRYSDKKYQLEIPRHHYHQSEKIRNAAAGVTACVLLVGGVFLTYTGFVSGSLKNITAVSQIQITSHRGYSYENPENTVPAFEAAIDCLSDYIELDVQETKDGMIVVFHDSTLKRITGESGKIKDYTYKELSLMDFGGWFSEDYKGTKIPTLREVLGICKGNIKLNIEIKEPSDTIVQKVLNLVTAAGMEDSVEISSMNYKMLLQVKEEDPDMTTGYILTAAYGDYFNDDNVDFFSIRAAFITQNLVDNAHSCGKQIYAWTVNTKAELSRMKRLQVDNVITDRPVLAREMLYREADTENIWEFLNLALRSE